MKKDIMGIQRPVAWWVLGLMVVGTLLCIRLWGTVPRDTLDTLSYRHEISELGDALREPDLDLMPYRTLGYPAVITLTGSQQHLTRALFVVQLLFHLITVWIVVVLGRRFSLRPWALVTMAAVLLTPPLMQRVTVGGTEAACEVLLALTALFLVRWGELAKPRDALFAGIAIALAAFVRPTYQLFGILVAAVVYVWLRKRHTSDRPAFTSAMLLAAGSIVLIGGMVLLNTARFGYPGFSPTLGWNLSTKTAGFIEFLPEDEPAKDTLVAARNEALASNPKGMAQMYVWPHMDELKDELGMDRAEISSHMLALNLRLIALHPARYLASVAEAGASYLMPSTGGEDADYGPSTVRDFPILLLIAHVTFVILFFVQLVGVIGLAIARRLGATMQGPFTHPAALLTWGVSLAIVAYTAIVSITIDVGYPRLRIPTDPLIILMVFGGFAMCAAAFRARPRATLS